MVGAAMELEARIGFDGWDKEAGKLWLDKAATEIDLSGTSDFGNYVHAGIGY